MDLGMSNDFCLGCALKFENAKKFKVEKKL